MTATEATPNKRSNEEFRVTFNPGLALTGFRTTRPRAMAAHVHSESWYFSLSSSAKQQREMTKFYVFWRMQTAMANFRYIPLELSAVGTR